MQADSDFRRNYGGHLLVVKVLAYGLGKMGEPIVRRLHAGGHAVVVDNGSAHDVAAKAQLIRAGVAQELRQPDRIDAILFCLPDLRDVQEAALRLGMLPINSCLLPDMLIPVLDFTTHTSSGSVLVAADLETLDPRLRYIDCPVSGSLNDALGGTLTIMVGGGARETHPKGATDLLTSLGETIVYCGNTGDGQKYKLLNQLVHILNIGALYAGHLFIESNRLDPSLAFEVLTHSSANSVMLQRFGEDILHRTTGRSKATFRADLARKDFRYAIEELPDTALCRPFLEVLQKATEAVPGLTVTQLHSAAQNGGSGYARSRSGDNPTA